jgi:predicted MFS family arabinose efflux permease
VDLCGLPPSVASWSLALIGLANIVGSLVAGWAGGRYRSKMILVLDVRLARGAGAVYLDAPRPSGPSTCSPSAWA